MAKDDLTTGPMSLHFRNLAVPAAFGMLFATLYNVVDVFYAGQLSTSAQAGLAIGYQAFFVLMAVAFGLSSALSALVSNAKGSKDPAGTRVYAAQGLGFGMIATVVLAVFGLWFGPKVIILVSEAGDYRDAATGYFYILMIALPGFVLAYGGNGILQAHGDTVSMQRALMVAFFANIALNPLFMYGLPGIWGGIGFNGIAVATVVSQTGVMAWVLWRIFQLDMMRGVQGAEFIPVPATLRAILVQLLPASIAMIVMFLSGFIVQFALKGFGADAIAAYGVALRVEQILLLPVLGMTGALLPIVGQNFGARDFDRVRAALFFCWKTGFAMAAVAMPLLWFGGATAMSFFTDDPDVIAIGASYLRVDGFLFPIYMMLFAINSLLQGMKKPMWTLWISIYRQGFGIALFVWLFVGPLGFDVWGVWYGIAVSVTSGWLIALVVLAMVTRQTIGGLFSPAPKPA